MKHDRMFQKYCNETSIFNKVKEDILSKQCRKRMTQNIYSEISINSSVLCFLRFPVHEFMHIL